MPSDKWEFDSSVGVKRYRNLETGRFISRSNVLAMRDEYVNKQREWGKDLAGMVARKEISVQKFEREFRDRIKTTYGAEYMFGRGGKNAMTSQDWGRLGPMIREQYVFAHGFAADIAAGRLTEAQIAARADLYFSSATYAFERGHAAMFGELDLPAYPGDGGTACKMNCRCHWDIKETTTVWRATWRLTPGENCEGCRSRAGSWNPYEQEKAA